MKYHTMIRLVACLASMLAAGSAGAQTPAAAPEKPATDKPVASPPNAKPTDAEKRAKAADCTQQANAKKLHGAAREKFRESCKKA